MKNSYGLDVSYFEGKLQLVVRDIKNYTPDELARVLARLSNQHDSLVEQVQQQQARIARLEQALYAIQPNGDFSGWEHDGVDIGDQINAALNNTAPAADGWISVSERLPETKRGWAKVLAYCSDSESYAVANFHDENKWRDCNLWSVTHWMPLPSKPAQGAE